MGGLSKRVCALCSDAARVYTANGLRCLPCVRTKLSGDFRKALGRAGASGPDARLAVAVSGGYNSGAIAALACHYLHSLQRPPGVTAPRVLLLHAPAGDYALEAVQALTVALPGTDLALVAVQHEASLRDKDDARVLRAAARCNALISAAKDQGRTLLWGVSASRAAARIIEAVLCGRAVPPPLYGLQPLSDMPTRLLVRYARDVMGDKVPFVGDARASGPIAAIVDRFVGVQETSNANQIYNVVRTCARLVPGTGVPCLLCATPVDVTDGSDTNDHILCIGCQLIADRALAYEQKKQSNGAFESILQKLKINNEVEEGEGEVHVT